MLYEPKLFSSVDETRKLINELAYRIVQKDPEFIVKAACYLRETLNIRSTANYVFALSSAFKQCRPFLSKYGSRVMVTPADLLEVFALARMLPQEVTLKEIISGKSELPKKKSIGKALRICMINRLSSFSAFQLCKYAKKPKKRKNNPNTPHPNLNKPMLPTLKQVIRYLHASKPANIILPILGKKYPQDEFEFDRSGLAECGLRFNKDMAGIRMKLPTVETWETILAAKGNNAESWNYLIVNNRLSYIALLRNLRNIIICEGLKYDVHQIVIKKLTDKAMICKNKIFPFQFMAAYRTLEELESNGYEKRVLMTSDELQNVDNKKQKYKKVTIQVPLQTTVPFKRAINSAMKISIINNLPKIKGRTVVFVDCSQSMRIQRGNFQGATQPVEMGIILGLILLYICEDADLYLLSSRKYVDSKPYLKVTGVKNSPESDNIFEKVVLVKKQMENLGLGNEFFYEYFEECISKKHKIDKLIILNDMSLQMHEIMQTLGRGDGLLAAQNTPSRFKGVKKYENGYTVEQMLQLYRKKINSEMKTVTIDLIGASSTLSTAVPKLNEEQDKMITGFSDNVLRHICKDQSSVLDEITNLK